MLAKCWKFSLPIQFSLLADSLDISESILTIEHITPLLHSHSTLHCKRTINFLYKKKQYPVLYRSWNLKEKSCYQHRNNTLHTEDVSILKANISKNMLCKELKFSRSYDFLYIPRNKYVLKLYLTLVICLALAVTFIDGEGFFLLCVCKVNRYPGVPFIDRREVCWHFTASWCLI